jgi:hypothetical protein
MGPFRALVCSIAAELTEQLGGVRDARCEAKKIAQLLAEMG